MADIEITDEASLEAWLKTRPRRDAEIIAFRAAARVFPLWGSATGKEWAEKHKLTSLPTLRILLSICSPNRSSDLHFEGISLNSISQINSAIELAKTISHVMDTTNIKAFARIVATIDVINYGELAFVVSGIAGNANVHEVTNAAEWHSAGFDNGRSWQAITFDAEASELNQDLPQLPLWPTPAPDWFTTADRETRAIWAKDPTTWAFWEKWWDGVISGDMPFAEGLLRDVALIEDDIWQAGPKAVAEAIARIEKIHDLRAQLAALTQAMDDEDLSQVQQGATLAHRGHNNPPEMIEAIAIVQASAVDIAQALDDAREELAKPAPEPSRLKAIGTGMLSALKNAAKYCGGLADKFLQEFAGAMGKKAATVVAWLIAARIGVSLLTDFANSMIAIWPF